MYRLYLPDKSITSDSLVKQLETIGTPEANLIKDNIQEIERHGVRYSNQDFDVLSRAFHYIETANIIQINDWNDSYD